MVCFDNSAYYLDAVIAANIIVWLTVFLPQYIYIGRLVASLNFSVIALTAYTATFPNQAPGQTIAILGLNLSFVVLFLYAIDAVGSILFVFATVLFLGPITFVAREHISHWFNAQLGWPITDFEMAIGAAVLAILLAFVYAYAGQNRNLQLVLVSGIYSLLVAVGARALWIQFERDSHPTDSFCCGPDYEDYTCPFIFKLPFVLLFVFLFVIRLLLVFYTCKSPVVKATQDTFEYESVSTEEIAPLLPGSPRHQRRYNEFF